jgi:hypothetical protein
MKTFQCRAFSVGKSLTNERTLPYLVEIPVAAAGLDVPLNRQIMKFHESRQLQLRHGRMILRGGEIYYRWCFPDSMTTLAFVEQFGGRAFRVGSRSLQQTPPHPPRQYDEGIGIIPFQKQTVEIGEPSL